LPDVPRLLQSEQSAPGLLNNLFNFFHFLVCCSQNNEQYFILTNFSQNKYCIFIFFNFSTNSMRLILKLANILAMEFELETHPSNIKNAGKTDNVLL
jgi:hypothetical protein